MHCASSAELSEFSAVMIPSSLSGWLNAMTQLSSDLSEWRQEAPAGHRRILLHLSKDTWTCPHLNYWETSITFPPKTTCLILNLIPPCSLNVKKMLKSQRDVRYREEDAD